MPQHVGASHRVVGAACRPGVTRTGRCKSGKAQMLKYPSAADIPGIGKYKAALLVKFAKARVFRRWSWSSEAHLRCCWMRTTDFHRESLPLESRAHLASPRGRRTHPACCRAHPEGSAHRRHVGRAPWRHRRPGGRNLLSQGAESIGR